MMLCRRPPGHDLPPPPIPPCWHPSTTGILCPLPPTAAVDATSLRRSVKSSSCNKATVYRYYSLTAYSPTTNVSAAIAIDAAVARNCSKTILAGMTGMDQGLGPSLYGNLSNNYQTAKVGCWQLTLSH